MVPAAEPDQAEAERLDLSLSFFSTFSYLASPVRGPEEAPGRDGPAQDGINRPPAAMVPKASAKLAVCQWSYSLAMLESPRFLDFVDISEKEAEDEMGASGSTAHLLAGTSAAVRCCLSQAQPCFGHWGPKGSAMER